MRKGSDKVRWINAELLQRGGRTHRSPNVACSGNAGSTMNLAASAAAPGRAIPRPGRCPGHGRDDGWEILQYRRIRASTPRVAFLAPGEPSIRGARPLRARRHPRRALVQPSPRVDSLRARRQTRAPHRGSFTRTRPNVGLREEELNSVRRTIRRRGEGEGIDCRRTSTRKILSAGPSAT